MESDEETFNKQDGEALEIGDEFDSEDDQEDGGDASQPQDQMRQPMKANLGAAKKDAPAAGGKPPDVKGQKVENQPFDLAVDVDDSEEIDSDEEDDHVNVDVNVQQTAGQKQAAGAGQAQQQMQQQQPRKGDDEDSDDEKEVPGAYNPAQYADLPVSPEVKELFEYIQRYKP